MTTNAEQPDCNRNSAPDAAAVSHKSSTDFQIAEALQDERERLAKLLHDDVLQAFGTCLLKVQLCERLAQLERYDQLRSELPRLQETLNETIDKVRAVVSALRHPAGPSQ